MMPDEALRLTRVVAFMSVATLMIGLGFVIYMLQMPSTWPIGRTFPRAGRALDHPPRFDAVEHVLLVHAQNAHGTSGHARNSTGDYASGADLDDLNPGR